MQMAVDAGQDAVLLVPSNAALGINKSNPRLGRRTSGVHFNNDMSTYKTWFGC